MARRGTVSINFNPSNLIREVRQETRLQVANRVWGAMVLATRVALAATPVWTGDTRANYRWGVGRKGDDYRPYNQHFNWRAKIFPVDPYGADSVTMSALQSMRATVYADPFQRFVLYNNVQYENGMTILDLEYGTLTGTAHLMMSKARQALEARVGDLYR